jgi:hypothetical protein
VNRGLSPASQKLKAEPNASGNSRPAVIDQTMGFGTERGQNRLSSLPRRIPTETLEFNHGFRKWAQMLLGLSAPICAICGLLRFAPIGSLRGNSSASYLFCAYSPPSRAAQFLAFSSLRFGTFREQILPTFRLRIDVARAKGLFYTVPDSAHNPATI